MKKASADNEEFRKRHLPQAVQHANVLQQRKDVQATILNSIEELIDFPTSPNADPAHPSAWDLAAFQAHIAPFQISDYEAVIEERNAIYKCGYVFCPRPVEPHPGDGLRGDRSRLVGRGRELTVVPSSRMQRWCGRECLKRAMYIQIQLSDVAAWQRHRGSRNRVVLWQERDSTSSLLNDKMGRMSLDDRAGEEQLRDAMTQLAVERGDLLGMDSYTDGITVKENEHVDAPEAPMDPSNESCATAPDQVALKHVTVEGYTPKTAGPSFGPSKGNGNDNDNDNENDNDWDLR